VCGPAHAHLSACGTDRLPCITHHPIQQAAAEGRILVQDRFLDDNNRAALLCRARHETVDPLPGTCSKRLAVPSWFSNSMLSVVGRGAAAPKGGEREMLVPITEALGDHREHQDQHVSVPNAGEVADGNVGVVYLQGDGDFVLTDTATGAEHREPIVPGKLISWPNAGFMHRVEGASRAPRRMVGPLMFDAASESLVPVGCASECIDLKGYECVDPQPVTLIGPSRGGECALQCNNQAAAYDVGQWNSDTLICSCLSTCDEFVLAPLTETVTSVSKGADAISMLFKLKPPWSTYLMSSNSPF
jgi:hypothetical protein